MNPTEMWKHKTSLVKSNGYTIDGRAYPRVSNVLAMRPTPGLDNWRKRVGETEANRIKDETAEWGHNVHLITSLDDVAWEINKRGKWYAEQVLHSDRILCKQIDLMIHSNDDLLIPLLTWREWRDEYVERWIAIELLLWSDKLDIAGTVDRVGVMCGDRRPSIGDLKSKTTVGDETGLQLNLYKRMYNEKMKGGDKVDRTFAIHMPRVKTDKLRIREFSSGKFDAEADDLLLWHRQTHT